MPQNSKKHLLKELYSWLQMTIDPFLYWMVEV